MCGVTESSSSSGYDSSSSSAAPTPNSEETMTPVDSVASLADVDTYESTEQAARVLIEFIVTRSVITLAYNTAQTKISIMIRIPSVPVLRFISCLS